MFQYVRPTPEQESWSTKLQAGYNRQVAKGLKTMQKEEKMPFSKLCARILRDSKDDRPDLPCPGLLIVESENGPMVRVAHVVYDPRIWRTFKHPDRSEEHVFISEGYTLIPLRDYWATVLVPEKKV